MLLTVERLKEVLSYNPMSGDFIWIASQYKPELIGKEAGCISDKGYRTIKVDGKLYRAHRLAWLYVHGKWPKLVDHKDGIKSNNAILNLRDVSQRTNCENLQGAHKRNKLGILGVHQHKTGKFTSQITIKGVIHYLGVFDTPDEASTAYLTAKRTNHLGNTL